MDATVIVSIAGLTSTVTLALVGPIINGRIANRNVRQAKAYDLAIAAYTEAIVYVQASEARMDRMIDQDARPPDNLPEGHGNQDLISAKLRLAAAPAVLERWIEFLNAEDHLRWFLGENWSPQPGEDTHLPGHQHEALEVRRTARELVTALRAAIGAPETQPQRWLRIRRTSS